MDETGWEAMRARLVDFKSEHKHCRVPEGWTADPKLARWTKKQREYKRRLDTGRPNPRTTAERVAKLEALGSKWSMPNGGGINEAGWEAMLARLAVFKAEHFQVPNKPPRPADPAEVQEKAGRRPPEAAGHERASGQARGARVRMEPTQIWRRPHR